MEVVFLAGLLMGAILAAIFFGNLYTEMREKYLQECKWAVHFEHQWNIEREENFRLRESLTEEGEGWKLR